MIHLFKNMNPQNMRKIDAFKFYVNIKIRVPMKCN